MALRVVLLAVALLAGCQRDVAVRPEKQRAPYLGEPMGSFVRMNQSDAEKYLVSGVYGLQAETWRWTGRQAVLRLHVTQPQNLKYVMRFAVPQNVIARNSPVRLDVLINGKKLETLSYKKDGVYEIEKPVPPELLKADEDNIVTIEINKPLPADANGPELGFILVHAGFQPRA